MAQIEKKLTVKIGPTINHLTPTKVNNDSDPQFIDSPYFTGKVVVRIKDFKGNNVSLDSEKYFEGKKRTFAIQVSGRFKHDYLIDDIVFGSEFEKKVIPPTGIWVVMKFAKLIDPGVESDLYYDKPWIFSPIFSSMNIVNVHHMDSKIVGAAPSVSKTVTLNIKSGRSNKSSRGSNSLLAQPDPQFVLNSVAPDHKPNDGDFLSIHSSTCTKADLLAMVPEWKWRPDNSLVEDNTLLTPMQAQYDKDESQERRKFFQKENVRQSTVISTKNVYNFEVLEFN